MPSRSALLRIAVTLIFGGCFVWTMVHLPIGEKYDAVRNLNGPISLFGVVVDQDGHALPGVQVGYRYSFEPGNSRGRGLSPEETVRGRTVTDAAGRFAIEGMRGRVLAVESLSKEGYSAATGAPRTFAFYGEAAPAKPVSDRAHPVEFRMLRTGP